jgi:glucan phosphoethanolaminetransferase (alkaline phosphatase superfamily)
MEQPVLRTWIMFFLISFVALLWAAFLSAKGTMLWVSLMLVIVVLGVTFFTVFNQIKLNASRQKVLRDLTKDIRRSKEAEGENAGVDDRIFH